MASYKLAQIESDSRRDLDAVAPTEVRADVVKDLPNRADFRRQVENLLAFNNARLSSDSKLQEVVQKLRD